MMSSDRGCDDAEHADELLGAGAGHEGGRQHLVGIGVGWHARYQQGGHPLQLPACRLLSGWGLICTACRRAQHAVACCPAQAPQALLLYTRIAVMDKASTEC